MFSPYCGDASRRSTTFSYAFALLSARKASISESVGGKPVSVNVTRLINVSLSASFAGVSPSFSRRATMNASMELGFVPARRDGGGGVFVGEINAQCGLY